MFMACAKELINGKANEAVFPESKVSKRANKE